jgi:uncharacterized protein (DUF58 family)
MDVFVEVRPALDHRRFLLAVRGLADSIGLDWHASGFAGPGTDYLQARPYQPGDPSRSIHWKMTARVGELWVKEFEAQRGIPAQIVLDRSVSMCLSSQESSKYGWAVQIAGAVALASLAQGRPVGLITHDAEGPGERIVPPSPSATKFERWLHRLRRTRLDGRRTLDQLLRAAGRLRQARSLLYILSDLQEPDALRTLDALARRHDCIALQLQDPAERGGLGGLFRAREAETGRDWYSGGRSPWSGASDPERRLKKAGIDHCLLPIDRPEALVAQLRRRLGHRGDESRARR